MPDEVITLETLELKAGSHWSPKMGMCAMEAVAYFAHEPFSAYPKCACPVLSGFIRTYNDNVDDQVRQSLKPYILRLIGTRSTFEVEMKRSFILIDWLIRVHNPAWFKLAGLERESAELTALPEIASMEAIVSCQSTLAAHLFAARRAEADADNDVDWAAARSSARAAKWATDWLEDWNIGISLERRSARAAAGVTAVVAERLTVKEALAPTVLFLQSTVPALIERMLAA